MKTILLLFCLLPLLTTQEVIEVNHVDCHADLSHEYYVSTCDINFNAPKKRLEITLEFDAEDIENVLEEQAKKKLRIGSKKEAEETNQLLEAYLQEHFILDLNHRPAYWQFMGKEVEDHHHLSIYLQITEVSQPEILQLTHSALIDVHEKQANIVHANIGDNTETLVFQKGLETQKFTFGDE